MATETVPQKLIDDVHDVLARVNDSVMELQTRAYRAGMADLATERDGLRQLLHRITNAELAAIIASSLCKQGYVLDGDEEAVAEDVAYWLGDRQFPRNEPDQATETPTA